jgi:FtsP/CotA-like multicopper oxidase with cupredoxin domain
MLRKNANVLAPLAAALVLSACGGSKTPGPGEQPATTAAPAETEPATREESETVVTETETIETETAETATAGPPAEDGKVTVIRLEDGKPQGGVSTIEVKQGDVVRFRVQSDQATEIHVHGYDIEQEAVPGKPAVFKFRAELEGIFEVESHLGEEQIVKLVVEP